MRWQVLLSLFAVSLAVLLCQTDAHSGKSDFRGYKLVQNKKCLYKMSYLKIYYVTRLNDCKFKCKRFRCALFNFQKTHTRKYGKCYIVLNTSKCIIKKRRGVIIYAKSGILRSKKCLYRQSFVRKYHTWGLDHCKNICKRQGCVLVKFGYKGPIRVLGICDMVLRRKRCAIRNKGVFVGYLKYPKKETVHSAWYKLKHNKRCIRRSSYYKVYRTRNVQMCKTRCLRVQCSLFTFYYRRRLSRNCYLVRRLTACTLRGMFGVNSYIRK